VSGAREFPASLASVRRARDLVREALAAEDAEVRDAAELMVSELATNSIKHARSAFTVTVERAAGEIRVQVHDSGRGRPVASTPTTRDASGRGLQIVALLSSRWGVVDEALGKTVWFALRSGGTARREAAEGASAPGPARRSESPPAQPQRRGRPPSASAAATRRPARGGRRPAGSPSRRPHSA
jgi:hypothetical protein